MHAADTIVRNTFRFVWGSVMLFILLVSPVSAGQEAQYFGQLWEGQVPAGLITATTGDLSGNGVEELVLATPNTVYVYVWDDTTEQFTEYGTYQNFPAQITSLATAKALPTNDKDVLLVGMSGSGAIQMYTLDAENRTLRNEGTAGRLWNAVKQLLPIDSGDGEGAAILAQGVNGEVIVLQHVDGRFQQTWRTPFEASPEDVVAVGDVSEGETPIVVLGQPDGIVTTFGWQRAANNDNGIIVKLFENHPWGAVRSLDIVRQDVTGPLMSLFITTSRNILYEYEWDGQEMIHVDQWSYTLTPGRGEVLRVPQQDDRMWFTLEDNVLSLWRISSQQIQHVWDYPELVEWFTQTRDGTMIAYGADQTIRLFGPVTEHHVRVSKDGRTYPLQTEPIVEDDAVYLAASDIADILSLRSWLSREGRRLTGIAPWFQFFIIDAESQQISINGKQKQLDRETIFRYDTLYIPMSFVEQLGYVYEWIPQLRLLYIES